MVGRIDYLHDTAALRNAIEFADETSFELALPKCPNGYRLTYQYLEFIRQLIEPFRELEDGNLSAFIKVLHERLIYLAVYYEKPKVAREGFLFVNNLEENLKFDPRLIEFFAHNCKYRFKDVDIELLHSVLTRTICQANVSNETIANSVLLLPSYRELKKRFVYKSNHTYKSHEQRQREEPSKHKHTKKRAKIVQLFMAYARAGLLDKIEDCRKDVDVIEKVKEGKVIKLVATKDGVRTGIKSQLSKFDIYLQGKKRQVDAMMGVEEDLALDDCLSGKTVKEIPDILKALAVEFQNLYPGNFTIAKENLYYRCSAYTCNINLTYE